MAPAVGSWVTTPWKPERTVWESAKRRVPWALVSPCRSPRVISPVAPVKPVGFSFSLRPVGRAPRAMAMPVPPAGEEHRGPQAYEEAAAGGAAPAGVVSRGRVGAHEFLRRC